MPHEPRLRSLQVELIFFYLLSQFVRSASFFSKVHQNLLFLGGMSEFYFQDYPYARATVGALGSWQQADHAFWKVHISKL